MGGTLAEAQRRTRLLVELLLYALTLRSSLCVFSTTLALTPPTARSTQPWFSLCLARWGTACDKMSGLTHLLTPVNHQETSSHGLSPLWQTWKRYKAEGAPRPAGGVQKEERNSWRDAPPARNRHAERRQQLSVC